MNHRNYLLIIVSLIFVIFFAATLVLESFRSNLEDVIAKNNSNKKLDSKTRKIKYHVPKFMLDLYERNKFNKNYNSPDVVRSLIPNLAESFSEENNDVLQFSDNHLLIFTLPKSDKGEEFVAAELKILTIIDMDENIFDGLTRKLKLSIYNDQNKELSELEEIQIHHSNNTWVSFNLTPQVVSILNKNASDQYLKLVISVKEYVSNSPKAKNNFKLSLMPTNENIEHDYPVLLLSYTSNDKITAKRSKRNIEEDYEEESNNIWDKDLEVLRKLIQKKNKKVRNPCRRKPLYVNFSEIDYDIWIVQPKGYEAYQCQGRCYYPVAEHLNPTKHAIVQALMHSVAPLKATRSCCVPTVLNSISILYVDAQGVLTYRYAYKDMVVEECGCR